MADGPLRWGILGTGLIAEVFATDLDADRLRHRRRGRIA